MTSDDEKKFEDASCIFRKDWFRYGVDPDLPQGVIVVHKDKNIRAKVDEIARRTLAILEEKYEFDFTEKQREMMFPMARQSAWLSLIEEGHVNAIVGIDWGVDNGEAEDEKSEDEDTEGDDR